MKEGSLSSTGAQHSPPAAAIKQWSGFKTAANTPIRAPSSNAMLTARQRMQELDNNNNNEGHVPPSNATAYNKSWDQC